MLTIKDVMTPCPFTVTEEQSLEQAKHFMYEHGVRHLPVLRQGKVSGILSDRDVKLAYAVEQKAAAKMHVSDACTDHVYAVGPETPLNEVAATMAERRIGSVVVTINDRVVGIFTATDACKVLSRTLHK